MKSYQYIAHKDLETAEEVYSKTIDFKQKYEDAITAPAQ
jgi:hypothetical protein